MWVNKCCRVSTLPHDGNDRVKSVLPYNRPESLETSRTVFALIRGELGGGCPYEVITMSHRLNESASKGLLMAQ